MSLWETAVWLSRPLGGLFPHGKLQLPFQWRVHPKVRLPLFRLAVMMRLANTVLVLLVLLISSQVWAQAALPETAEKVAAGSEKATAWAEVVPFAPRVDASILRFAPSAKALALDAMEGGAALVCLGGDEVAIDCRSIDLSQATTIEPWLAPGAFVQGKILLGREPLAGAEIAVVGAGYRLRRGYVLPLGFEEEEAFRTVKTDDEGVFELPQLAVGDYRLEVIRPGGKKELTEPFTVPRRETLLPRTDPDTDPDAKPTDTPRRAVFDLGAVTLEPGLDVAFSVLTAAGEALEGADVGGIQTDGPADAPTSYSAVTDTEGRAVITGVEPGVPFQASCRAKGYARHVEKLPSPPTDVVCVMEPLAAVSGLVMADGEPLAGATASLFSGLHAESGIGAGMRAIRRSATDEEGRFEHAELEPGPYRLVVAAPGFEADEHRMELASGERMALAPFELIPATEVEGVVVDAETGEPIPGASLLSLQPAGAVDTTADDEGRFRFAAEAPDGLKLQVGAAGYPAAVVTVIPDELPEDETLRLELAPGGRIEVLVYDSDTGQPCLGCNLSYGHRQEPESPSRGGLRTDAAGTAGTGLLAPGPYRVTIEEVTTHGTTVSVHTGRNRRDVVVEPHRVTPVVFGEPREILRVHLWPVPPPGWQVTATDERGSKTYTPDSAGRFDLQRVSGSAVQLRLSGGSVQSVTVSLATVPSDWDEPRIDLEIPRTAVHGRLVDADGTAVTGPVRARAVDGSGSGAWTLTRGDGIFELPFLPPGSYRLLLGEEQIATFSLAPGQQLDLETLPPVELR